MQIGTALGILAASVVSVSCVLGAETVKETRELNVATASGAALKVRTSNGGIAVVHSDSSEMRIKATLTAKSKERLEAIRIVATNDPATGNDVRVEFPAPVKGEQEGCSLVIEVPKATNVNLAATNGNIALSGTAGTAKLESSNGGVEIKGHDGSADIATSNGPVTASAVSGPIKIATSNAPVTLDQVGAPFRVSTSNGPVEVRLSNAFAGVISLSTSNGKISFPAVAKVESQSGNKGYGNADAKIAIRSGGDASTVRTSNAPISVKAGG